MFLHEGEDHGPGIVPELAALHLTASVLLLGKVDLQLVQQSLLVHLGQVGDQDAARTHLSGDLQDERTTGQPHDTKTEPGCVRVLPPPPWEEAGEQAPPPR